MINIQNVSYFCCEDISLIENYDKAINDTTQVWDCHHKLEIRDNKSYSKKEMMNQGLYYNRPANELMFLTRSEHMKLHYPYLKYNEKTDEIKQKISNTLKGKPKSEETKRKIAETLKKRFTN